MGRPPEGGRACGVGRTTFEFVATHSMPVWPSAFGDRRNRGFLHASSRARGITRPPACPAWLRNKATTGGEQHASQHEVKKAQPHGTSNSFGPVHGTILRCQMPQPPRSHLPATPGTDRSPPGGPRACPENEKARPHQPIPTPCTGTPRSKGTTRAPACPFARPRAKVGIPAG